MELESWIVEAHNIRKTYRTGFWLNQLVTTLRGVSLAVRSGETFCLLGPNGAGKTTLLKILLGIANPTVGSGTVLGRPLGDRAVKQRVGYLPENAYFYDHLTGWEYLEQAAALFQIPRAVAQKRIVELLDWVQLSETAARKKLMKQYSKGMLQRVGMAQALINDPEVIFLDEPMSGLDPIGRHQFREIVLTLKERGKTIFFNSHILSDVEQVCDRVAILAQGELLCVGSLDELLGPSSTYRVVGRGGTPEAIASWLTEADFQGDHWRGLLKGDPAEFLRAIDQAQAQVLSLNLQRPSLEDFFMNLIRDRQVRPS
ncbi:ABC transporter ATP-binding protein [Limnothrix sp. FACHB-708]|uniref:ABC transporter ATP-binding protein n=1 Tax=unclassified Limnothrix TaxID=2632864 RepID=UPI0016827052|nr:MULTISPECIES: ABC transporter ATP-binding protein [unclassified Limnothrix]MBD2552463.1 ABC transporter ATP-binding protein [Limnothrix sp. FACHB-708]MBD2590330.1 ABC transporter ATP-binding protein [Limnothrix sp. FACHB-406]